MSKRDNITDDAFSFIKYRCLSCRKILTHNRLFCNNECRDLYFGKINDVKIKSWTNKGKPRTGASKFLDEEKLKAMVKETERNIDKKMNRSSKLDKRN